MAKAETAILDQAGITRAVTRIAHEILEHNKGCENLALIGIRSGGDHLASLLRTRICDIEGVEVPIGEVDITMYRDDLAAIGWISQDLLIAGHTGIKNDLAGNFTGRTKGAAMEDPAIGQGQCCFHK